MNIQNIRSQINQNIKDYNWGNNPKELYDPISYIMELGGKRMRPLLVFLAYHLFKEDYSKVIKPAIAVELFHNFTLVHDDIMDEAPLRRGQSTVHEKWNNSTAILSGDVMLVKVYDLFLHVPNTQIKTVIKDFNDCASWVCEGQQLDMNFETIDKVSESEYLDMIRLKTAVLLGFSLKLGGIIAETNHKNLELLTSIGENLGIGFQLKDDLLDVYGDADKFGKQVGGDIIANKKTFLLIKALEKSQGKLNTDLQTWLDKRDFDKTEKINAIKAIYNELDIKTLTEEKINLYFDKAFEQMESIEAEDNKKALLKSFAEKLVNREK